MDGVSGAAAILSLIKTTQTVSSWISYAVHAAEHIGDLHSELEAFKILVNGLQRAVDAGTLPPSPLIAQIDAAIAEATQTINRLRVILLQARNGTAWDLPRLRFVLRQSQCAGLRSRIQRHTCALTGIMLVVIHDSGYVPHTCCFVTIAA